MNSLSSALPMTGFTVTRTDLICYVHVNVRVHVTSFLTQITAIFLPADAKASSTVSI
jgi:hypothetical protein